MEKCGKSTNTQAYFFGTISILIISLLSLSGAVIIPCLRRKYHHRWMQFFIALAVATLAGDSLLHLIPEVLGVHKDHSPNCELSLVTNSTVANSEHDDHNEDNDHDLVTNSTVANPEDDDHDEHDEAGEHEVLLKMSVIAATFFALYLFEALSQSLALRNKNGHSHGDKDDHELNKVNNRESDKIKTAWYEDDIRTPGGDEELSQTVKTKQPTLCCGLKPLALMILIGDGIHNFGDGIAVGVAFALSNSAGISTSIAVVCHELPHEIGDFAVLLDTGLPVWKALLLNLASALTAFIGLYIGIAIGQENGARPWLFAIVAGMFLYVALVDMLHHLMQYKSSDMWYLNISIQISGMLFGFTIIFLLGWFEEKIKF